MPTHLQNLNKVSYCYLMVKIIFIQELKCEYFLYHLQTSKFHPPSTREASRLCLKISDVFWYLYKWIFDVDLWPQRVSSSCGLPLVYPAIISSWYLCVSCHRVIILDEDTNLMKSTLSVTFVYIRDAISWKCFHFQLNLAWL